MQDNSRRWALRRHTASAHATVDEAVGGFKDLQSYKGYLQAVATFRRPIEASLATADWPRALGGWRPHTISAAICADLADLGLVPGPVETEPRLALSGDELFGAIYVLEGSALGARVLFERAKALGLSATYGARHLALQAGSSESWRAFLARLEEAEPFDLDGALAGSTLAFAHARHAFAGAAR